MNKENFPAIGLKASYCLPYVSMAELAAILITILIQPYSVSGLLNNTKQAVTVATILMLVILFAMVVITIKYQRGNSFRNYCSSVVQTYNLRRFSKIPPKTIRVKVGNEWKNQRINDPAERAFNQALQGWYIDIRKNSLTAWLLKPVSSGSQAIFEQNLSNTKMKIEHDNLNYTYSPVDHVGNFYKIEGTLKHK